MMTFLTKGGSLAALAAALAIALPAAPAAAQDGRAQARAERQQARGDMRAAPARERVQIAQRGPQPGPAHRPSQ